MWKQGCIATAGSKLNQLSLLHCLAFRYFGAAKQLPGVKELFEKEAPKPVKRSRKDMYSGIDHDYYGFRDEEDGLLLKVEAAAEKKMRAKVRWGGSELAGSSALIYDARGGVDIQCRRQQGKA
jgi:pre-mRNA-splicing factor ISY1